MRMLEKEREARFATCVELAGALEVALAGADASWDVPLMDPEAPELASTEEETGKVTRDAEGREALRWNAGRPRRGQKARRKPVPELEDNGSPVMELPAAAQEVVRPAPAGEGLGVAMRAGHSPEASPSPVAATATSPVAHGHESLTAGVSRVGAGALAFGVLLLGAWLLAGAGAMKGHTAAPPTPAPGAAPLPPGWLASHPTLHASLVREVAMSTEPSEAEGGAIASLAPPPAPTFATMLRKNDARLKPEEKPATRSQRRASRCVPITQETCVVGICTLLLTGCTGTPQVVRPPPRPADCPPEALKAMKELGIHIGDKSAVDFPVVGSVKPVTVRESTPVETLDVLGQWGGGIELTGRLYLGPERVYGRFTQARAHTGKTYPVCFELIHRDQETLGAIRKDVGGPADSAVVSSSQYVRAVDRFE
jgi:serine/threonine-protein kinase